MYILSIEVRSSIYETGCNNTCIRSCVILRNQPVAFWLEKSILIYMIQGRCVFIPQDIVTPPAADIRGLQQTTKLHECVGEMRIVMSLVNMKIRCLLSDLYIYWTIILK
jgi:hypothetical protein